ncbi:hypothetical protein A2U01_0096544, partial [Trifolium medium]|nr:hypothetical protein [Trifolium medium]
MAHPTDRLGAVKLVGVASPCPIGPYV